METRSFIKSKFQSRKDNYRYNPYNYNRLNKRTSFTDSQFIVWKQRIDNYVYNIIGQHLDNLPDQPYRAWFEQGFLKPSHISHIVLGNYYQLYNLNKLYFN